MDIVWNEEGFYEISNKPTADELKDYYQDKYVNRKLQHGRAEYDSDEYYNKSIGSRESSYIVNKEDGRLLDIGCGEGFYLQHFDAKGWDVTGLDFSLEGIEKHFPHLKKHVIEGDVFTSIDNLIQSGKRFDLITLNHVLEHVLDPKEMILKIRQLMSDNGMLRVSVPNDFSLFQAFLKRKQIIDTDFWICYPDHLNYFNIDGIKKFMRVNGFNIIETLAEFPIELYLLNKHSHYIQQPETGHQAHKGRVLMENMLAEQSISGLIEFRRACATAGIGRVVSVYCQ